MTRPMKQINNLAGSNQLSTQSKEPIMHNLKYLTLALLLATLAITPAFAKPGQCGKAYENSEQKATRLEHLKERLDLTAQQETEIK